MRTNDRLLADFRVHLVTLNRSPATVDNYRKNVGYYLRYLAEHDINAVDATADDIEAYQGTLIGRHLVLPTVASYMDSVRVFYRHLRREQHILRNPFELVDMPRVLRRLPRNILTEKEVRQLLSMPNVRTNKGVLQKAVMETFYSSAIRLGELCALSLDDVDTAKGELRIRHGKGDKFRIALIGNQACMWLRYYREVIRPKYAKPNEEHFFLGLGWGRPINPQIVRIFIRRFGRKLGIKKQVSPHSFRHAAATHLIRRGASLLQVRELLGHVFVTTTLRYVEVTIADLKREMKKFHPRA